MLLIQHLWTSPKSINSITSFEKSPSLLLFRETKPCDFTILSVGMDPYGPKRGLPVAVLARREVSRHHDKVSPAKRTPRRSLTTSVPPLGSLTYRSLPNRAAEFDNVR